MQDHVDALSFLAIEHWLVLVDLWLPCAEQVERHGVWALDEDQAMCHPKASALRLCDVLMSCEQEP